MSTKNIVYTTTTNSLQRYSRLLKIRIDTNWSVKI